MSKITAKQYGHARVDPAWLNQVQEPILEPDLPIIDPHHHLWHDRPSGRYMPEELAADLNSGHAVEATVFIQCGWMHRLDGPEATRPAGETTAVTAAATLFATGAYGPAHACAGIVGWADLRSPTLDDTLDAHEAAGAGRFRGVRHTTAWDDSVHPTSALQKGPGLLADQRFRAGLRRLSERGLTFEAWQYHPQLGELLEAARAAPDTRIVINHLSGPLGGGHWRDDRETVMRVWREGVRALAGCPNLFMKLAASACRSTASTIMMARCRPHPNGSRATGGRSSSPASSGSALSAACSRATSRSIRECSAIPCSGTPSNALHRAPRRPKRQPCSTAPRGGSIDFPNPGGMPSPPASGAMISPGPDGRPRCRWCAALPELLTYHDTEWGFPVGNDRHLFEKLCLEGFQSGLSWRTILAKRENFRAAFQGFEVDRIAGFTDADVARLLTDVGIVRHRGKIEAVVNNAKRMQELVRQEGSLAAYVWRFEPAADELAAPQTASTSATSIALSKDLKKRGWSFVGPTTVYAFMQAMGLINDHADGCVVRDRAAAARIAFKRPA